MKRSANRGFLHKGLKRHSPPGVDSSMRPPRGSVDDGAVRTSVAKTPRTLGPRNA